MAKDTHGYERTEWVSFRLSKPEKRAAEIRRGRSGAKTLSAYARESMLTGMEFEVPAWGLMRDTRNALIQFTHVVVKLGSAKTIEAKCINTLDQFSQALGKFRIDL